MSNEQLVEFFVYVKDKVDQSNVKQVLERIVQLAKLEDVQFGKIWLPCGFSATTTQKTYERLFSTKLDYKVEVLQSHKGSEEIAYKNWVESKRAKIPELLEDSVQHVTISIPSRIFKKYCMEN